MNNSPRSSETGRSLDVPKGYRNILKALVATTALSGTARSTMNPRMIPNVSTTPGGSVSSASISTPSKHPVELRLPNPQSVRDEDLINSEVIPMLIAVERKAWPDVPTNCVYTGVVLVHDRYSTPHKVLLENMCIQRRGELKNIFEGRHLWVDADAQSRFKIPFHDSHLQEKGNRLIFVADVDNNHVEEPLGSGYERGTTSFEQSLNNYQIRPIITQ